ncbi:MAG: hypothetical protein HRT69_11795 [Flavobacteriaceae bacterium]|nr:hypothetical protein [Flavobacteriaceae bacterium]
MEKIIYKKEDLDLVDLDKLLQEANIVVDDIEFVDILNTTTDKYETTLFITPNASTDVTILNAFINGIDPKSKEHVLRDLCVDSVLDKELTAINYKTELKSEVRLDTDVTLTNDGLINETVYYYEKDSVKVPVIKIKEGYKYQTTDLSLNPAERGMYSQEKTWQYYLNDGTLDTSEENTKVKLKVYKTNRQILAVGLNRRTNLVARVSTCLASIGVLMSLFKDDEVSTGKKKAYDALRNLSREFSTDFTEYKSYATTNLYDAIENDKIFTWLDSPVPTKEQLVAAGKTAAEAATFQGYVDALELNDMQNKTIRTYFIEKLKGLVK